MCNQNDNKEKNNVEQECEVEMAKRVKSYKRRKPGGKNKTVTVKSYKKAYKRAFKKK